MERHIRNDHAQGKRLNADLLVRVLTLRIKERHNIRVVRIQVHRARALASTELISIAKRVLKDLHDGDNAARNIRRILNGRAGLTQVSKQQTYTAAALRQLQGRVDTAPDRFHVVLDTKQETGHHFTTTGLTRVQERWGRRLETPGNHDLNEILCKVIVPAGKMNSSEHNAILKALKVNRLTRPVLLLNDFLCRVALVKLHGTQQGLKAELVRVRLLKQRLKLLERVHLDRCAVPVPLIEHVARLFLQRVIEARVGVDFLKVIGAGRVTVCAKINRAVHRYVQLCVQIIVGNLLQTISSPKSRPLRRSARRPLRSVFALPTGQSGNRF